MKQRRTEFVFPFMPGHFHMSPLLSYPSITSHSGQDSCLGLKHIHSSAVHQIAPNTVILQSSWRRGWMGGRSQRGTVVLLYPACLYGLVTSYLMTSKTKKKKSYITTHADRCRISKCRFESEFCMTRVCLRYINGYLQTSQIISEMKIGLENREELNCCWLCNTKPHLLWNVLVGFYLSCEVGE